MFVSGSFALSAVRWIYALYLCPRPCLLNMLVIITIAFISSVRSVPYAVHELFHLCLPVSADSSADAFVVVLAVNTVILVNTVPRVN